MIIILLTTISLIFFAFKSALYKKCINENNFFERGLYYFMTQGFLLTLIGFPLLSKNIKNVFFMKEFYILFISVTLSTLGLSYLFKKSNPTIAVTMIAFSSIVTAIIYIPDSKYLFNVIPLAVLALISIFLYKKEAHFKLDYGFVLAAIFLIFIPQTINHIYAPFMTKHFSNATSIYGIIKFTSSFLIILLYRIKPKDNLKAISKSVIFSTTGQLILFLAFAIGRNNPSLVLITLAFEPLTTELITSFFHKDVYLGNKSKLQKTSITVFCICLSIIIYLVK